MQYAVTAIQAGFLKELTGNILGTRHFSPVILNKVWFWVGVRVRMIECNSELSLRFIISVLNVVRYEMMNGGGY